MNEQPSNNAQEPVSRSESRRQRREQRLTDPSRGGWIVGLILILLGGMFLLGSIGIWDVTLTNWWALFILLPAFGTLSAAWRTYQEEGQLNSPARISLLIGLVLTFIAFTFLFGINWIYVGPILIIVVGIAIILNYFIDNRN